MRLLYYHLRKNCPLCGSKEVSQTYVGYIFSSHNFEDRNSASCQSCGWSGLVHDLMPDKVIISAFPGVGKSYLYNSLMTNRTFDVRYSGHGSAYMPEVESLKFCMTWNEASSAALDWEHRSDTIGGRSMVVGKQNNKISFYDPKLIEVSDSDSSKFSWLSEGVRNPEFPINYIQHIRGIRSNVILVSSHEVVRDALSNNGIYYTLVYPHRSLLNEYTERFKSRGSPDSFIKLVRSNWDSWMDFLDSSGVTRKHVLLSGQYISDILPDLISNFMPLGKAS